MNLYFKTIIMISMAMLPYTGISQYLAVAPGTVLSASGGMISTQTNVINNGTFTNEGNSFVFKGSNQTLSGDSPIIFDNVEVSAGSVVTLSNPGNTIGGILHVDGTLNPEANLTLLSDSLRTAMIDGSGTGQVTGRLAMQRYFASGFGYKYISSPFISATVDQLGNEADLLSPFPQVYYYDENRQYSGWVSYSDPSDTLEPMRGYSVNTGNSQEPLITDIEGVPNNGKISLTLYNHNQQYTKGFNFVGNPYPSPVDWNSEEGWTKTNIDDAIFYFIPGTDNQYTGTYSSYQNSISSDGTVTGIIDAMQGFFVHVTDGTYPVSATLEINNNARMNGETKASAVSESKGTTPLVRISAGYSDNISSFDPFVIYYNANSTSGYDGQYDALKLFNTDNSVTNFYVFAEDNNKLSINALPFTYDTLCSVRLGLKTEKNGEVLFTVKDVEGFFTDRTIRITDVYSGKSEVLTTYNDFSVYLAAGDYQNRFYLNIYSLTTGSGETVFSEETLLKAWASNGCIKTRIMLPEGQNGKLTIVNQNGQVLLSRNIYESGSYELPSHYQEGIYIITLTTTLTRKSVRVVLTR